ncbi:hypothetical protein [Streptomyces sp. Z38]|uniref:hypothetical protein n=1 Tax=Streptomyces sp. Z38 TaxID=2682780 RepID=UPI0012EA438C|nr:hypothetical protein [Streptomyces sp. Z38]MUT91764.1 hypothetical protein [Streptomyces sp. Z38]
MTDGRRTVSAAWRLAVAAYVAGVFGLGAALWHWVLVRPWGDSLSFALTLTVSVLAGQWITARIRRGAGRGDG